MSNLVNFKGLNPLDYIGSDINICCMVKLQDFTGLENLEVVQGRFQLCQNPQFSSLQGLFTSIGFRDNVVIRDYP